MQQSRAVLVTGDMHHKVWDSVIENYTKSFKDDGESSSSLPVLDKWAYSGSRGDNDRTERIWEDGPSFGDLIEKTDGDRERRQRVQEKGRLHLQDRLRYRPVL